MVISCKITRILEFDWLLDQSKNPVRLDHLIFYLDYLTVDMVFSIKEKSDSLCMKVWFRTLDNYLCFLCD